ncbi:MAG: amidohydrolase [Cellvibrionales bacterium]|nr:amidohydrolase [Cellvibrionales bacterium]
MKLISFVIFLLSLLTVCINTAVAEQANPEEITVFVAKKIVTMDPNFPTGTAVAIKGDRIISVGTLESLKPWLKGRKVTVNRDFENNILFPGLVEPHLHPLLGALQLATVWITPESWNILGDAIPAITTPDDYQKKLTDAINADKDSGTPMFITWGYSKDVHGPLNRQMLDKIESTKPIFIWQRSAHEGIFNTAALKWMGLTEKDVTEKYKDSINFDEGHFIEAGFFEVSVPKLASYILSPEFIDKSFEKFNRYLIGNGVTTTADMAFSVVDWDMEMANYKRNLVDKNVPFRTVIVPDAYKLSLQKGGLDQAFNWIDSHMAKPSTLPQIVLGKRIKMFSDGAIFSQLMQMHPPGYIDGHEGQWLTPPDVFLSQSMRYWKAGYRIHVHSNGDAGIDNTLNVLQALQLENPRKPHSFIIEHYGYADDRLNRRTQDLGAAVSANPYYLHLLGDKFSKDVLGNDRAQRLVPLAGLVDRKVPVALHSDFGMAPADPLLLAWAAATRKTVSGKSKLPPRALTVEEAMRSITIDAAYILGLDQDIGSIQAGKKSDFVVLDKNPLETKADKLKDIKVLASIFEGNVVKKSQNNKSI